MNFEHNNPFHYIVLFTEIKPVTVFSEHSEYIMFVEWVFVLSIYR